jgi:hypothetical protein
VGMTPADWAEFGGHLDLAARLAEQAAGEH